LARGRSLTRLAKWHRQRRGCHEITPRPGGVPIHGVACVVDADLPMLGALKLDGFVLAYPKRLAARINARGPVPDARVREIVKKLADRLPAR
jgi:hypothetical protein